MEHKPSKSLEDYEHGEEVEVFLELDEPDEPFVWLDAYVTAIFIENLGIGVTIKGEGYLVPFFVKNPDHIRSKQ